MRSRLLELPQIEGLEVLDRLLDTLPQLYLRLPAPQMLLGTRDVWLALLGIVARQRHVDNLARATSHLDHHLRQLLHCELVWITNVHRPMCFLLIHKAQEGLNSVVNIAERSRLRTI